MNEEFPKKEYMPNSLDKDRLVELGEKIMPQGPGEKVKNHLNIVVGMLDEINHDGFGVFIDEDTNVQDDGVSGKISITLVSNDFPDVEVPFIQEEFNDNTYAYTDELPHDEESIREAYSHAKNSIQNIIRNTKNIAA